MPADKPSLITGLDPAGLFALADESGGSHSADWEPPSLEEVARLFPAWKVLGLLGRGGMGAVYHMHQPELDREVAVKLLPLEASLDERQVERFRREARTLAKLRHPGIVALHEAGITPAGHFFFVMEHVDGFPLSRLIAEGRVGVPKAIGIVREVCDALAYAHSAGVVHRDIKPSNILIDAAGHAHVADFGLARWEQPGPAEGIELSRTGMFMGTPAYTAPEQARDAAHADHRADIYSLGVLLYEMLTGELPRGVFQPPSRKAGTDARLDEVVHRALQERPEDRYQAAAQLKEDVSSVQAPGVKIRGRSRTAWIVATLAAAVLVGLGWVLFSPRPADKPAVRPVAIPAPTAEKPVIIRPPPVAVAEPPKPAPAPLPATPAPMEPAKPPAPVPTPAPAPVAAPAARKPAHVWSIEPVSPALTPPAELMKEAWKDAVLVRSGGAVLLEDAQTLVLWSEATPGKIWRHRHDKSITSLAATADTPVALDQDGTLLFLPLEEPSGAPRKAAEGVAAIFSTAHRQWIAGTTKEGDGCLWKLDGTTQRRLPNLGDITQLTATADGVMFALLADGTLLRQSGDKTAPEKVETGKTSKMMAAGGSLLLLDAEGQVAVIGPLGPPPARVGKVTTLLGGDDIAIAVDATFNATLWGAGVSDAPQRIRVPADTTHLRASPRGVMAAW